MAVEVGAAADEYAIAVAVLLSAVDVDVRRVVQVEVTHPGFARGGIFVYELAAPHGSVVRWCGLRVLGKPFLDFFHVFRGGERGESRRSRAS